MPSRPASTSATVSPHSRAISPGWGVITSGAFTGRGSASMAAATFSPSASSTTPQPAPGASSSTRAAVSSVLPIPGPSSSASQPRLASRMRLPAVRLMPPCWASWGQGRQMHSGRRGITPASTASVEARVTSPAPPRSKPSAARAAAPRYRAQPATASALP